MARRSSNEDARDEASVAEDTSEASTPKLVSQAHVYDARGTYVRTYSAENHGPDFRKLADMYAGKIGGSVRK